MSFENEGFTSKTLRYIETSLHGQTIVVHTLYAFTESLGVR